jgi:PPM family protein phosphatase
MSPLQPPYLAYVGCLHMSTATAPIPWTPSLEATAESASATHVGRVRARNEDALLVTPRLLAVADGMGGANAGDAASRVAIETLRAVAAVADPAAALSGAVTAANGAVHALSATSPELDGMGTTVTAAALADGNLTVAHVGDSRLYRLRHDHLERLTDDHTLAAAVPGIAEQYSHVLLRAVGPGEDVEIDVDVHPVESGDRYLICSDGLTNHVADAEIAGALAADRPLAEIAAGLVDVALARGGNDNVTVVLFAVR